MKFLSKFNFQRIWHRWIWATIAIIALMLFFSLGAQARSNCARHDAVHANLTSKYGERIVGVGVAADKTQMIIYAHPQGASWTVVAVQSGGVACLMAAGKSWMQIEAVLPKAKSEDG